jgi:antitoxin MazE
MGANDLTRLELSVGRWGNSLAVRLPAELARELGLVEGSTVEVERQPDNSLRMVPPRARQPLSKAEWIKRAQEHLATMPRTPSVIREMRDNARY